MSAEFRPKITPKARVLLLYPTVKWQWKLNMMENDTCCFTSHLLWKWKQHVPIVKANPILLEDMFHPFSTSWTLGGSWTVKHWSRVFSGNPKDMGPPYILFPYLFIGILTGIIWVPLSLGFPGITLGKKSGFKACWPYSWASLVASAGKMQSHHWWPSQRCRCWGCGGMWLFWG